MDETVREWFTGHFEVTDGRFDRGKSSLQKRCRTVTNLEMVYQHFCVHMLTSGREPPAKMEFAHILQRVTGLTCRFVKNAWVGTIKRALNVRPKSCEGPGSTIIAYSDLKMRLRAGVVI